MDIRKWFTNKKISPNKDNHSAGAATLQKSATASCLNETGTSVDVTTKLVTAAGTSVATTVPSLPPSPLPSPPPPPLPGPRSSFSPPAAEPDGSCASVSSPSPNRHLGELSRVIPDDLRVDKPKQVLSDSFPVRLFSEKIRTFASAWYQNRPWLEYSVKGDAVYCFPCRQFRAHVSSDLRFTVKGLQKNKGLNRHASSKDLLVCEKFCRAKQMRIETGQEITTLVHKDHLARNRYYVGSINDILAFLAISHLPFRGDHDSLECMAQSGSGLFLSMFEHTLEKES